MPNGDLKEEKKVVLALSQSQLAIIGSVLAIATGIYGGVNNIATKGDIAIVEARVEKQDERLRSTELALARFFGQPPGSVKPSSDDGNFQGRPFVRVAQLKMQPPPTRRVVVPEWFINDYLLEPTEGGAYAVLGEDGKYYSIDDVMAMVIRYGDLTEPDEPKAMKQRRK